MAISRPDYRHGRIIGAYLTSTITGKRELHPAVIVSPDSAIVQPAQHDPRGGGSDNEIVVIGISTKYRNYPFPYIKLPYDDKNPKGHPHTGLTKDCAAIIGWYHVICIDDDRRYWGKDVPQQIMRQVDDAIRKDLTNEVNKDLASLGRLRQMLSL